MVFILVVIGSLLILLNVKAIKKEDNSFSAILKREESIENRDYDVEIISIRKDLAESILDIQKEMEDIRESVLNIKNEENRINFTGNIEEKDEKKDKKKDEEKDEEKDEVDDIINDDVIKSSKMDERGVISEIDFTYVPKEFNKVDEVKMLVKLGITDDEICEKMSIGKGEVLLIKGLFKS